MVFFNVLFTKKIVFGGPITKSCPKTTEKVVNKIFPDIATIRKKSHQTKKKKKKRRRKKKRQESK